MAKSKGDVVFVDYASKKESEDPVAPCQGWVDPCEFCDKRFGNWVEANEETLAKIPTKPGIFMVGLLNKNVTEVVDIVLDTYDVQKVAYNSVTHAKDTIADKKSKFTKSVIQCRWMTFKHSGDKDVTSLCAHWYNNGVLPKFINSWPGLDILEKTENLMFSDYLKKWCYPKKDAFWRKPKSTPTKVVEIVQGCNWTEPCEVCDNSFSNWKKIEDVIANDLAPETSGIFMVAVNYGKTREVINIYYDAENIKVSNIRQSLEKFNKSMSYVLRNKKFANRNPFFQVRWMEMKDTDNDNCCFLYAHWLNADSMPMLNHKMLGEQIVDRNKHFVIRSHDKKWCYEIDVLKPIKITKSKQKKTILNDLEDDIRHLEFSDYP
ncbi:uncharacterized protein NPIL_559721 [Nephila pilipes]|uniref:Uncharacterized protein n=1 Tax=Nephila pilipes TaxID=299642 RepID=A0A8X6IS40_NEPPI|nr:uncharacterized protein NPIL_559721 [Nephila pilipes]